MMEALKLLLTYYEKRNKSIKKLDELLISFHTNRFLKSNIHIPMT